MAEGEQREDGQQPIALWKDKKLLAGFILVGLSIATGFFGKGLFIVKFYEPVYLVTGLSLWAFSWILLLAGILLVGIETIKMVQYRIHHHVKKTVRGTYHYTKELSKKGYHHTKELPKKSYHYSRELHRKGVDRISKTSKVLFEKIRH